MSLRSLNDEERRILTSGLDGAAAFVVGSLLFDAWNAGAGILGLLGDIWAAQVLWAALEAMRIFAADWYHSP